MARKKGYIRERNGKYILFFRGEYKGTYETFDEADKNRLSLIETYKPVDVTVYLPLFAERLNLAIGMKDRSVVDICKQAGIHPSSISHYLNGNSPNTKALIGLALALNVSTDWLLGLEGNSNEHRVNV